MKQIIITQTEDRTGFVFLEHSRSSAISNETCYYFKWETAERVMREFLGIDKEEVKENET